jgi:hypothetical protein
LRAHATQRDRVRDPFPKDSFSYVLDRRALSDQLELVPGTTKLSLQLFDPALMTLTICIVIDRIPQQTSNTKHEA